jgi:hypothetical protein
MAAQDHGYLDASRARLIIPLALASRRMMVSVPEGTSQWVGSAQEVAKRRGSKSSSSRVLSFKFFQNSHQSLLFTGPVQSRRVGALFNSHQIVSSTRFSLDLTDSI